VDDVDLNDRDRKHVAGLMRINHTGEVCAQALYQGQAATARLDEVREAMETAAGEEVDHLAWCEERLQELDARPSIFNPLWYTMSYGLGALAGIAGDKWSLGFVAETENQVCEHLEDHLNKLPEEDEKSKAILEQMLVDEKQHETTARDAGGTDLPNPLKQAMTAMSQVMKETTYRL
jgi:ubiquinone biosynthesis monooxygenase Coq7